MLTPSHLISSSSFELGHRAHNSLPLDSFSIHLGCTGTSRSCEVTLMRLGSAFGVCVLGLREMRGAWAGAE